jgi:hypothetical protein
MRGRSITLTVAAALISAGTPAAQTPTTDHSGISTAAQTTETTGQAQSFEDRWPAQAAAPYLPSATHVPTATAPQTPTTDQSGISTAAQTTETAGQAQSFEDRWPARLHTFRRQPRPRRRRLTSQAYLRRPRPLKQPAKPRVLRIDGPPKRQHPTCHRLHTFRRQPRRHLKRPAKLPCQRKWAQRWTVLAI